MRKSRFTDAQIIGMIKEQEAGLPTSELCRKHELSPATFFASSRPSMAGWANYRVANAHQPFRRRERCSGFGGCEVCRSSPPCTGQSDNHFYRERLLVSQA